MQKTLKLSSGYDMPVIGLGTWQADPGKVGAAVKHALLNANYNHIDCAAVYGNEKEIGAVLQEVFTKRSRDSVFITSKLWNTEHRPADVEKACRQTLSDLGLEYLDLYLMHWGLAFVPGADARLPSYEVSIRETWEAMEQLVKKGLVKSIGVANFTGMMLADLLTYAQVKPAMNQIELHPYLSQAELVQYCHSQDIAVTAYSPLGRAGVTDIKPPRLFDEPIVLKLAKKYAKTVAQVLLNWAIMRDTVAIPKSTTPARIDENIDIFDFELEDDEIGELNALNCNRRFVDPSDWWNVPCFK